MAHILLLGLLKDFWAQFLPTAQQLARRIGVDADMVFPPHVRKAMTKKAPLMQSTSGCTKRYQDVVTCALLPFFASVASVHAFSNCDRWRCCSKHSSYLMEQWLDFTEFYSLAVLFNLPWNTRCTKEKDVRDTFVAMWTVLRSGVLYFMRYTDGQHTEDGILQAQKDLLQYGKLAEQVCVRVLFRCLATAIARPVFPTAEIVMARTGSAGVHHPRQSSLLELRPVQAPAGKRSSRPNSPRHGVCTGVSRWPTVYHEAPCGGLPSP